MHVANSYSAQVVALWISLIPIVSIVVLIVGANVYQWHRNHRHGPHPH